MTKEFWNQRYTEHDTVYGKLPNQFFKEQLQQLQPGKLLLPAEGEGRNAIFAAKVGWNVDAFDYSSAAAIKALKEAKENGVTLQYSVQEIELCHLSLNTYDAIGLIFVHLAPKIRAAFHAKCVASLKPGGRLILEGFSKEQLRYSSGGPKDETMLYSSELLLKDFYNLQVIQNTEEQLELKEGVFHRGEAAVVRFVGVKA